MAIQLLTARTSLENLKKDISDVPSGTFLQWCQFISDQVYRSLIATDSERWIQETTISVTAGTETYALPVDFRDISAYGCGLYLIDTNGKNQEQRLTRTNFGFPEVGYYISGANIVLTPNPVVDTSYRLRYIPKGPVFSSVSDYFTIDKLSTGAEIVPDEFLIYLRNALDAQYGAWDEDVGAEGLSDQRFVRAMDELIRNVRREPDAYGLPDFSVTF